MLVRVKTYTILGADRAGLVGEIYMQDVFSVINTPTDGIRSGCSEFVYRIHYWKAGDGAYLTIGVLVITYKNFVTRNGRSFLWSTLEYS